MLTMAMMLALQDAPPSSGAQPVTPRGAPSSWVSNQDYPMALMRAHATGVAGFTLEVDAAGRVSNCRITATSGWPTLDLLTCSLMRRRARFNPARDASGAGIPSIWSSRFNWGLPDEDAVYGSWARVVRFVIDADGEVRSCTVTAFGTQPRRRADPCRTDAWRMKLLHGPGTGLVTVSLTEIHRAQGMPMPANFVAPAGRRIFVRSIDFTVEPQGALTGCSVREKVGDGVLTSDYSAYDCHTGLHYLLSPAARRQAVRKASFTVAITTDNDAALVTQVPPVQRFSAALPPPPAPSPPPSVPRTLVTPRGSPQAWITNDDYPAAALRTAMSGAVDFRLDVDEAGIPTRCTVTASSGHELLDTTTCALMMRRARFHPATGHDGRPVAGIWPSRMRWELPSDGDGERPGTPGSWTRTLTFTIAEDGGISDCHEEFGRTRIAATAGACFELSLTPGEQLQAWRGAARGPVTLFVRYTQTESGTPGDKPAPPPPGLKQVLLQRASFQISDAGFPVACNGTIDALQVPLPAIGCWQGLHYPVSSAYKSMTVTQVVMTSGDPRVAAALKWPEDY